MSPKTKSWAEHEDVWNILVMKDEVYQKERTAFVRGHHQDFNARAIVLDWLMQVSKFFKLRRETFYLASDYFDRYMAKKSGFVDKNVQLIGITALFIAAKMEELTYPSLKSISDITGNSCTETEILDMEAEILKTLEWHMGPMTSASWVNIFLQVDYFADSSEFLLRQFPLKKYAKIMKLLDLCTVDAGCLEYSYRVLAASAIYHFVGMKRIEKASGIGVKELRKCIKWMVPFTSIYNSNRNMEVKDITSDRSEEDYMIQSYNNPYKLLLEAKAFAFSVTARHMLWLKILYADLIS
ncbi:G1/S-specific cyclin-E1-like [Rhinophrynus dorsalis]